MPWKISSKRSECSGYAVVDDKNKVVGCHQTRAEALAHQRALYASENKSAHSKEENERRGKRKNEMKKSSVVENYPECNGQFAVISDNDGELEGCYPTRAAAEDAIRQHDMGNDNPDDSIDNGWGGAFSPRKKK